MRIIDDGATISIIIIMTFISDKKPSYKLQTLQIKKKDISNEAIYGNVHKHTYN